MGDEGRMAPIAKARGEPVNEPDGLIRRAEKQSPGRRSHAPAVERGHEFAAARPSERHPGRTRPPSNAATSSRPPALPNAIPVALHCVGIGEHPPSGLNSFSQNKFYLFRDPDAPQSMSDAGFRTPMGSC